VDRGRRDRLVRARHDRTADDERFVGAGDPDIGPDGPPIAGFRPDTVTRPAPITGSHSQQHYGAKVSFSYQFWRRVGLRVGRPRDPMLSAPLLLVVLIAVVAVATPRNLYFSRFLPVAPALAASMWPVAGTVAIGVLAIAVVLVAAGGDLPQASHLFTIAVIAAVTAAASYATHVRRQRERTLAEVRSVADTTQKVMLRTVPPCMGRIDIATLYLAAAAQARVGGDFYEALETAHGVRLIVGDVRGKGLPAVGVASGIVSCFREAAYDEPDLARLADRLELSMSRHLELLPDDGIEYFATALLAEIPDTGTDVRIVNCGHPPPLLLRSGEHVREVVPTVASPPINMAALVGEDYRADTLTFAAGDRMLFYTDGVSETRDRTGAFFPLTERAGRWAAQTPARLLADLHEDLVRFSHGRLDDDIAAVAVRARTADPSA
jgi:serine phosphatase RsbU (regulator of sigma subunit)